MGSPPTPSGRSTCVDCRLANDDSSSNPESAECVNQRMRHCSNQQSPNESSIINHQSPMDRASLRAGLARHLLASDAPHLQVLHQRRHRRRERHLSARSCPRSHVNSHSPRSGFSTYAKPSAARHAPVRAVALEFRLAAILRSVEEEIHGGDAIGEPIVPAHRSARHARLGIGQRRRGLHRAWLKAAGLRQQRQRLVGDSRPIRCRCGCRTR